VILKSFAGPTSTLVCYQLVKSALPVKLYLMLKFKRKKCFELVEEKPTKMLAAKAKLPWE